MDAAGVVVEAGAGGFSPPNSPPEGVEVPDEAGGSARQMSKLLGEDSDGDVAGPPPEQEAWPRSGHPPHPPWLRASTAVASQPRPSRQAVVATGSAGIVVR